MKLQNSVARLGCVCENHFTVNGIDVHEESCPHFDPEAIAAIDSITAYDEGRQIAREKELEEEAG